MMSATQSPLTRLGPKVQATLSHEGRGKVGATLLQISPLPLWERAFRRDLAGDALERHVRKSHGGKGEGEFKSNELLKEKDRTCH